MKNHNKCGILTKQSILMSPVFTAVYGCVENKFLGFASG